MIKYNLQNWVEGFISTYTSDKFESLSELSYEELDMLITTLDDRIYDINNKINKTPLDFNNPLKASGLFATLCNEYAELCDMRASAIFYQEKLTDVHYSEADLLTCNLEN
jgi:hypothetical protein